MKIEELLKQGKQKLIQNRIEDANIIARVLLQELLNKNRNELNLSKEEIKSEAVSKYEKQIEKIIEGKPLQYITKKQEFMRLPFYVDENVLIPQPDTEILVEEVIKLANPNSEILDMCTGSGAIGISLARYIENSKVTLVDISQNALKVAKRNAKQNEVENKVKIIQSDMFEKVEEKYDVIVANPPYIETSILETLPKQVQEEPMLALDGGKDGLYFYRILTSKASQYLKENGYLCMEIGYDQKEKVIKLAQQTKQYKKIYFRKDLAGNDRIIICQK